MPVIITLAKLFLLSVYLWICILTAASECSYEGQDLFNSWYFYYSLGCHIQLVCNVAFDNDTSEAR